VKITEIITAVILFITMLVILWQATIAQSEYRAKNKPIVGIDNFSATFVLPVNDPRVGKLIVWEANKKTFICDGKEADVQGLVIRVPIKNFGTQPAIDFNFDVEIWLGNRVIKEIHPELRPSIIMPGQVFLCSSTIIKPDLYNAFNNNELIKLKYSFKYTDLTKKRDLFEYSAELLFDQKIMQLILINSSFKENR